MNHSTTMDSFDPGSGAILSAGGITAMVAAIVIPLWRRWLASNATGITRSEGEADWMRRQAEELKQSKSLISELLKLRTADAEVIAALKLDRALAVERGERMQIRMARMEEALTKLDPNFARWLGADFGDMNILPLDGKTVRPQ